MLLVVRARLEWYDCVMATTAKDRKDDRDVIARLADRGEQTMARLAELPGGTKALRAFNDLRVRVDELGRKARGVDELEKRVTKLEKELGALKRTQKTTAPKASREPTSP